MSSVQHPSSYAFFFSLCFMTGASTPDFYSTCSYMRYIRSTLGRNIANRGVRSYWFVRFRLYLPYHTYENIRYMYDTYLICFLLAVRRGTAGSSVLRWQPGGGSDREPLPITGSGSVRLGPREVGSQRAALQVGADYVLYG